MNRITCPGYLASVVTDDLDREMGDELCIAVREAANRVTGGNCAFADDDLALLVHLAERAVMAGLFDRLHWQVQGNIWRRWL